MDEKKVLCASNRYERKYYFNPEFAILPQSIRDELQIMCVLFTEEIGGILTIEYNEDGMLELRTEAEPEDMTFDEIGAGLKIGELQRKKRDLFESLELFYKVFAKGGQDA
jgi:hypothetical protein